MFFTAQKFHALAACLNIVQISFLAVEFFIRHDLFQGTLYCSAMQKKILKSSTLVPFPSHTKVQLFATRLSCSSQPFQSVNYDLETTEIIAVFGIYNNTATKPDESEAHRERKKVKENKLCWVRQVRRLCKCLNSLAHSLFVFIQHILFYFTLLAVLLLFVRRSTEAAATDFELNHGTTIFLYSK